MHVEGHDPRRAAGDAQFEAPVLCGVYDMEGHRDLPVIGEDLKRADVDQDREFQSSIDEADVAKIRVGLPVRIALDAFRDQAFDGTLTYVSSFVETRQDQNRTLRVEAEFAEAELPPNLLPGLSTDLEVILDRRDAVLRIPTYALLEGGRVLTVEDGLLVEREVTTGLRNWSYTESLLLDLIKVNITIGCRYINHYRVFLNHVFCNEEWVFITSSSTNCRHQYISLSCEGWKVLCTRMTDCYSCISIQ